MVWKIVKSTHSGLLVCLFYAKFSKISRLNKRSLDNDFFPESMTQCKIGPSRVVFHMKVIEQEKVMGYINFIFSSCMLNQSVSRVNGLNLLKISLMWWKERSALHYGPSFLRFEVFDLCFTFHERQLGEMNRW
jgi:hypothetical protein